MSHDQPITYAPGPLDELVPGLRRKVEKLPALPVHPRVVRFRQGDGTRNLVLLSFRAAASARALHAALKPIVEAALLNELCAPRSVLSDDYAQLTALHLVSYATQPFPVENALSPFGFRALHKADADAARALSLARAEALTLEQAVSEQAISEEPTVQYRSQVAPASHALAAPLHEALLSHAPQGAWGREPGVLARVIADYLDQHGVRGVAPTRAGIELLESIVVHRTPGVVRWIEPLLFQGLCDLVAVYAAARPSISVQWGVCEPDEESGLPPPPVLRVTRDGDIFHVPLGEHVLRWCVMPISAREDVPTLGAWAEHEFV